MTVSERDQPKESSRELTAGTTSILTDILGIKSVGVWGEKILGSLFGGISAIYEDCMTIKRAKFQAEARRLERAQNIQSDINEDYQKYQLERLKTLESMFDEDIVSRTQAQRLALEIRQQLNLEKIASYAIEYAQAEDVNAGDTVGRKYITSDDEKNIDNRVDLDWIAEFIECSRNTSKENLQRIWARVLADEVKNPGTFSIRTLLAIKTISFEEAEAFSRIADLYVEEIGVIRVNKDLFGMNDQNIFGVNRHDLLLCQRAGLIQPGDFNYSTLTFGQEGCYIYYFENELALFSQDDNEFELPAYMFTPLGQEMTRIAEGSIDESYFTAILEYFKSMGCYLDKEATVINPSDIIDISPYVST